ncbi:tyrosine-type recombinase/integrase [Chryseobacterium gambrini]|uniref:Tyrosine-type recombinase/integrase n=1 Tax=Chryseobacterium gambrini TaxID=373672 RepID=A0AAJ1R272_9FLAO|nr:MULTISPECIES: tyrosine-type recombinase/integrase [Chryseobacterium]MDN4012536.1 tyrosine-type recombinase/integrase [Chryseobacterium gambrini]QWA37305.1 tyrosine-type recombinase/integrase [Chryseobacterium sp. ZHDP1]
MDKINEYFTYKSSFSSYIEGFLREKEQKGLLRGLMLKCYMLEFDRFFIEYNITNLHITREVILQWKDTRLNDKATNLYKKYTTWVSFCKYMCRMGIECYIPHTPKEGRQNDYIPYIYTHEEINLLFSNVDKLRINNYKHKTQMFILPAFLRLLYSTGIRIGEALSITNEDVKFKEKVIEINDSKNDRQRIVAINDSLYEVLLQYQKFKESMPIRGICDADKSFFVTQNGKPCLSNRIYKWFEQLLLHSDVPKQPCFNRPRIHDIRHTAAVHALEKLVKSGEDIYCALPMISVFLGHKNIKSTEAYVRLTDEMFPDLIQKGSITSFVFPDMKYNKYE